MEDLPKVWEPFDQLGGVVLVELDVREVHLEDGRGRVPHPEEHQLRLPQVHRGERWVLVVGHGVAAFKEVLLVLIVTIFLFSSWHPQTVAPVSECDQISLIELKFTKIVGFFPVKFPHYLDISVRQPRLAQDVLSEKAGKSIPSKIQFAIFKNRKTSCKKYKL